MTTTNTNLLFDIVIPVGPDDIDFIQKTIIFTKKNIIGYRNIYIITPITDIDKKVEGCIMIDEKRFPFSINDVAFYHGKNPRNGWYLQQLIKLYASFVIEDIMDTYLVLDADTYILKYTTFFTEEGVPLYNVGVEYHTPYFTHLEKLHSSFQRQVEPSGICHHMVFQKEKIIKIFKMVCSNHKKDFWRVFLEMVENNHKLHSGASEYELYFHFLYKYYEEGKDFIIRKLKWDNCSVLKEEHYKTYHYITCNAYNREKV